MNTENVSALENFVWVLVPAVMLVVVAIVSRSNGVSTRKSFYGVAIVSGFAGLVFAPSCMCTDSFQKLTGALAVSVPINMLLFGCVAAFVALIQRKHRLAQQGAQDRRVEDNARLS